MSLDQIMTFNKTKPVLLIGKKKKKVIEKR